MRPARGVTSAVIAMKNDKDDYSILCDFDNLYRAHKDCRKGKRWKESVAIYDIRGYECTLALKDLLESGEYRLSPYNCFTLNERGKVRDIKSIKYHDRVVQKCLMDEIITPVITKTFVETNCASLKGKGTDFALKKCKDYLRRQVRKGGVNGYILICDMKGYFDSIPHKIVEDFYETRFEDEKILGLIKHIHASIPGGRGEPLGNQLSQNDALLALSGLDHMIKERLHAKCYVRYMDDFFIISDDKEYLKDCRDRIEEWVEVWGMRLNQKKTKIVTMKQGFTFLGFRFYVTDTGKVIQRLAHKSIVRHKKKLRKMAKLYNEGKMTLEAAKQSHNGWRAHAIRGDTYYLIRSMDRLFDELFKPKEENDVKTTFDAPGGNARQGHEHKVQ